MNPVFSTQRHRDTAFFKLIIHSPCLCISVFVLFVTLNIACTEKNVFASDTDWPEVTAETKPWTRWWWMGSAVDKENLTWNLEKLSEAGVGGVEITPIYGVKGEESKFISYLSPEWMEVLAHTETEASRLGIGVDMNTGTGWPFGGPEVTIEDAATKAIFQQYTIRKGEKPEAKILVNDPRQKEVAYLERLMAYSTDGDKVDLTHHVTPDGILDWSDPEKEWELVALFIGKTFQAVKRAAPGGEGLVMNHLDRGAVERYLARFENAFQTTGAPVPHSFFNDSYEVYGGDWTSELLNEFEKRRGYKLEHYFPELLADGSSSLSIQVITDYRETVSELLKENFSQVWTAWANRLGATTRNQAHGSPANLIDIYASVDIPECETFGITDFDIPYLRKDAIRKENDGDPTTLKYASSAANIAGKKYTSSETFTWLTEHFRTSLSQCKPEIDQVFLSGVNRVFFHGTTYSPQDATWPGWLFYASVNMSPTNSIWHDAPAFFEYITRVQSFLQQGKGDNDFLLYLPIYDIWSEQRGGYFLTFAIHGMKEKLKEFYSAVENIREQGYDLDYISDHFLETTTVEKGQLVTEGGTIYKALIIPSCNQMPLSTLQNIEKLIAAGATVIFSGHYPEEIPGLSGYAEKKEAQTLLLSSFPSFEESKIASVQSYKNGKIITGKNYKELLALTGVEPEPFHSQWGGRYLRKKNDTGYHYFLALLQKRPVNGWISLTVNAKSAMLFDPLTGKKGKARLRRQEGKTEVYIQMEPGESLILKTFTDTEVNSEGWKYYQPGTMQTDLNMEWTLQFPESNPEVVDEFNIPQLGSWTELDAEDLKINMGTGRYRKTIHLNPVAESEYLLSLGDVRESARVFVNGKSAGTLFAPPFQLYIGEYLKEGENLIEIEVTNLPANRIAEYDRQGIEWRIFHEINFVDLFYKSTKYDQWEVVPSGLLGPVSLREMRRIK